MTKRRNRTSDFYLARYLRFLAPVTGRQPLGSVSRYFLAEARIRYRVFKRSGCEQMRWACWSAVQIALRAWKRKPAFQMRAAPPAILQDGPRLLTVNTNKKRKER
jgi:hypothetical protein